MLGKSYNKPLHLTAFGGGGCAAALGVANKARMRVFKLNMAAPNTPLWQLAIVSKVPVTSSAAGAVRVTGTLSIHPCTGPGAQADGLLPPISLFVSDCLLQVDCVSCFQP